MERATLSLTTEMFLIPGYPSVDFIVASGAVFMEDDDSYRAFIDDIEIGSDLTC